MSKLNLYEELNSNFDIENRRIEDVRDYPKNIIIRYEDKSYDKTVEGIIEKLKSYLKENKLKKLVLPDISIPQIVVRDKSYEAIITVLI